MSISFFRTGHSNLYPAMAMRLLVVACSFAPFLGTSCTVSGQEQKQAQSKNDSGKPFPTKDWKWLNKYVEEKRTEWEVPGLAVAVVHEDRVVFEQGFGSRELGKSEAVDEHTLFAIASNSKAFTSAALAMLVDEGKVSWDDHVSDYLPWLKLKDQHASADLRVRDLLCHRSGLGTFSGDLLWWGTDYSPEEVLRRAAELEPAAPFRARYGYSNLMFLAAGEVVHAVSKQTWGEFIGSRVFEPLGMDRSITSVRGLIEKGNFATPHKTFSDRSEPILWTNWDTMAAAGGIISSVHDMSHWLRLQLRLGTLPDGDDLFSRRQSQTMWQAHMPITVSASYRSRYPSTHFRAYGLGWGLSDYEGRKVIGHGGGYDGMYSQVVMVPEENLGIVVLTNSMTSISPAITYRIMDRVFGNEQKDRSSSMLKSFKDGRKSFEKRIQDAITPVVKETKPSHELADYTGSFRCPLYGKATIELQDGKLVLTGLPNPKLVADLEHLHYDTFKLNWRNDFAWFGSGTIHFVADSRGKFQKLEFDVPNDDLWFYELNFSRIE